MQTALSACCIWHRVGGIEQDSAEWTGLGEMAPNPANGGAGDGAGMRGEQTEGYVAPKIHQRLRPGDLDRWSPLGEAFA